MQGAETLRRNLILATLMLFASTTIQAACNVSASGLGFGVYNPSSVAPADFAGTVTLNCSPGSGIGPYGIALSTGGSGSYADRWMSHSGSMPYYQLYLDPAHRQVWGDGTGGSVTVVGSDDVPLHGGTSVHRVYGRLAARRVVIPGAYTDIIVVTATY